MPPRVSAQVLRAVSYFQRGLTVEAAARKAGVATSSLYRQLERMGFEWIGPKATAKRQKEQGRD